MVTGETDKHNRGLPLGEALVPCLDSHSVLICTLLLCLYHSDSVAVLLLLGKVAYFQGGTEAGNERQKSCKICWKVHLRLRVC